VSRFLTLVAAVLALCPPMRAQDNLERFDQVTIFPASATFYIASVSMNYQPFVRHKNVFSSTYSARMSPFFFYSEKGHIWITFSDEALLRAILGEAVNFTGRALSDNGDARRIEGTATPTGPWSGRIRVRVFISRRIVLNYNTTYQLQGPTAAPVTPRPAR